MAGLVWLPLRGNQSLPGTGLRLTRYEGYQ